MKKISLISTICIVAMCAAILVGCNKTDPDAFDCPQQSLNYGDACDDGDASTSQDAITQNCDCAGIPSAPSFDCSQLQLNIGDACFVQNTQGTVDSTCNCDVPATTYDCPTLQANIGDVCDDNDANTTGDVIDSNCNCVGTQIQSPYDCPTLQMNIGDTCFIQNMAGTLDQNCDCIL